LRLDDSRAKFLKHISIEEGRNIREVLISLLDGYIEAHKETLEILSHAGWIESIKNAEKEVSVGKSLLSHDEIKKRFNVEH